MIRNLKLEDIKQIREIHERYYKNEFDFPNFFDKFLSVFVVSDDNDPSKIIAAGGIRTIAEAVIITDKSSPICDRRDALYHMLAAFLCNSGLNGYDSIHAFIQDPKWEQHLKRVGFKPTNGNSLILKV